METFLADAQLLLDFIMKGDNWLPLLIIFFAVVGILESIENLFTAIFGRRNNNNNNKE